MHWPAGQRAIEFLARQIERVGLQRAIGARLARRCLCPGGIVIGNVVQPAFGGLGGAGIEHDEIALGQVIEQRDHALFEQRQPMLHAGQAPAFADRLVQRIAGGIGAKDFAIAAAEPLDRRFIEQRLACRKQQMGFHRLHRTLRAGVEQAQRFELVAKEIEAQPVIEPGGIDIEDRAAHRIFAGIDHGIGARIALALQQGDQAFTAYFHARRQQAGGFADAERGKRALEHGIDRGDQQLRPRVALVLQLLQRRQPPRADRQGGRGTIERQAIPRREIDHVQLGCKETRAFHHRAQGGIVRRDEHAAALGFRSRCGAGQVGHDQRLGTARHAGKRQRAAGGKNAGQVWHGRFFKACVACAPFDRLRANGGWYAGRGQVQPERTKHEALQ